MLIITMTFYNKQRSIKERRVRSVQRIMGTTICFETLFENFAEILVSGGVALRRVKRRS